MSAVNRYKFSQKRIEQAKKYLKTKKGEQPSFLKVMKGSVKEGKLFLDDRLVVPKEKVETYLRNKILDGKTPLSRDAAHYWIMKNTVGVSRSEVDAFLKKQRIIRETDNQQPTSKRAKRRVKTKGQLHVDLVEIKFKDLPFEPVVPKIKFKLSEEEKSEGDEEGDIQKGYFFGCVDSLTSLAYYRWSPFKSYRYITPIAKDCFDWFSKKLQIPKSKMHLVSDGGSEFDWNKYKQWGLKTRIVKMDPFIENKNSFFQRVFYRVAKMNKTRDLNQLVKLALTQVNRTVSSISKKAPVENLKRGMKDLVDTYNKKRGPQSGIKIKRRPLVAGKDKVRIQLLAKKDKKMYKAYHGNLFSKRVYNVKAKRGNRYVVNGKLYHRDELRLTEEYDKKTEKLLEKRKRKM